MTSGRVPTILVIDDDPMAVVSVRDAVPGWTVLEARDGAAGMALVRTRRASLDLIVLDMRMPHDGIMTCVQIRAIAPELPILPFTGAADALETFTRLGCAPPLLKPAPPHVLAEALHRALGLPPPPLPYDPLVAYLHQLAAQSEHETVQRQRSVLRVAVLASSELLRGGLREAVAAGGGAVRFDTTSPAVLRNVLAELRVALLVADSNSGEAAALLAREFQLPLLVVALTMTASYRVPVEARGVVVEPLSPNTVAAALRALAAGPATAMPGWTIRSPIQA